MKQLESLRLRLEQHKVKNVSFKRDREEIYKAIHNVKEYINKRFDFSKNYPEYELVFAKELTVKEIIDFIKRKSLRTEFDDLFLDRMIRPEGGILFLRNKNKNERIPILFAEIKRQGTNDKRKKEGKKKQAVGNAIERLGKNLTGIRAMMNYEKITPFVCFGCGCDFAENSKTVLAKISMLNEFYPLNKTYVLKRDGTADHSCYAPVSMYFREDIWTENEMFQIMKEIAETSIRNYIF